MDLRANEGDYGTNARAEKEVLFRRTDFAPKLARSQSSLDQTSGSGRDAEIAANANIAHSPSQAAQPNACE